MIKLLFILICFATAVADGQTLVIALGQSEKISSPSGSLWIENKKILFGESAAGGWLLKGLHEGGTLVQAGSKLYRIQVLHPGKKVLWSKINSELKNYIGLQSEIKDGQIAIQGRIYQWQDWLHLSHFFKSEEVPYLMQAKISESLQLYAQKHFEEKMMSEGLVPMKIKFSQPPELRLSEGQDSFEKYEKIVAPFGISVQKDKSSIEMLPVVKLEMTILEINKNLKQKYGLNWPSAFSAQAYPQFNWNSFSADLDLLEQTGQAKILASPNLLCRSGQEASFVVGGEFPIKITSKNSKQVLWKNYGISLKFKPRADTSGRMSISIESEVSSLDTSLMVDGVPAIKNHRVSSHFDLIKSELVALSGLLRDEQGDHTQGIPGLSRLPVPGPLFGSKDFQNNKTELVIFVRPSVVKFEGPKAKNSAHHLSEEGQN